MARSRSDSFSDFGAQGSPNMRGSNQPPPMGREAPFAMPSGRANLGNYVEDRRQLLDILKDLHSTGIQNDLDLPQIVVIGSQSVGKSSLIESMSGLSLPRDTGTCTRCPMECRLQVGTIWSCKIVLRFQYDARGRLIEPMREVPFGEALHDKVEVERMLRRAQRAILRPTVDPERFLDDSDLQMIGHAPQTFSQNCVCIHVAGPNVPDLYFYDLPGIIANVGDGGNERDIALVQDLAKSYIRKKNCLILLVISCETDFENQGAALLVLRDAQLRERTIGVLTKVDRIEPGTSSKWVRILRNEQNNLTKGWFAVKQPDPLQLEAGISWSDARADEQEFFQNTLPWSNLPQHFKKRLGSIALSEKLGATLSDLVARELPGIHQKVLRDISTVSQELELLVPPDIADPRKEVILLLRNFGRSLSKHIEGVPPSVNPGMNPTSMELGLLRCITDAYERFRGTLHETAPQFRPWPSHPPPSAEVEASMIQSASEDDDAVGVGQINTMHVNEVLDLARRSRTRELPGNFPFSVIENLIRQSTQLWGRLAQTCFREVEKIMTMHVSLLVEEHFGRYAHGGLKDAVARVAQTQLRESGKQAIASIEGLYNGEQNPYTQNDPYFFSYRSKLVRRYKMIYRQSRGQDNLVSALMQWAPSNRLPDQTRWQALNNIIANLNTVGIYGMEAKDLARLLPDDDMDPALGIMAEVRAYFQVAYKRFGDNVPKQIDADFVRGIEQGFDLGLMTLDLSTEVCMEYLKEPAHVLQRRRDLRTRLVRLQSAGAKLARYYRTRGLGETVDNNSWQPGREGFGLNTDLPETSDAFGGRHFDRSRADSRIATPESLLSHLPE